MGSMQPFACLPAALFVVVSASACTQTSGEDGACSAPENAQPTSPAGLGEGAVAVQLMSEETTYDLDAPGAHAIYHYMEEGVRRFGLHGTRVVAGGNQQIWIDFYLDDDDTPTLGDVAWHDSAAALSYAYYPDQELDGSITLIPTSEGRVAGTIAATVGGGGSYEEQTFSASFDVAADLWVPSPAKGCE
jgi:hypothetical protein